MSLLSKDTAPLVAVIVLCVIVAALVSMSVARVASQKWRAEGLQCVERGGIPVAVVGTGNIACAAPLKP